MRSKNVWPRSAVIRTTMRSESTLVPPVTAERSPPDSRITGRRLAGDRRLVDRGDAFDDLAVGGDEVAGLTDDEVALCEVDGGDRAPRCRRGSVVGPRSPSASGEACPPAPCHDPRPSPRRSWRTDTVRKSQIVIDQVEDAGVRDRLDEGDDRADQHHEHHRVLHLHPRIELAEGAAEAPGRGSPGRRDRGPRRHRAPSATSGSVLPSRRSPTPQDCPLRHFPLEELSM